MSIEIIKNFILKILQNFITPNMTSFLFAKLLNNEEQYTISKKASP
jgi:hypothetical protein